MGGEGVALPCLEGEGEGAGEGDEGGGSQGWQSARDDPAAGGAHDGEV